MTAEGKVRQIATETVYGGQGGLHLRLPLY